MLLAGWTLAALLAPGAVGAEAADPTAAPWNPAAIDTLAPPFESYSPAPPEPAVPAVPPAAPPPGAALEAQLELGVTSQSGNTDKVDLLVRGRATRIDARSTLALTGGVTYSEALGTKNAQENSGAVHYDYYPWTRWSLFGFATLLNNPFQDLRFRLSVAAGTRYRLLSGRRGSLALSLAAVREDEEFLDGGLRHRNRFSWRGKSEWKPAERLTVTNLTFFVQTFSAPFDDYRVESTTDLTVAAGGFLALRNSFRYAYDTTPRPGVETTDRKIMSSVVLTLK